MDNIKIQELTYFGCKCHRYKCSICGTTACKRINRDFLGIEVNLNPEFIEIANKRLSQCVIAESKCRNENEGVKYG